MPVTLFHFTARNYLSGIVKSGIFPTHIEIPKCGRSTRPIVSLTSDPDPSPLVGKSLVGDLPLSGFNLSCWLTANSLSSSTLPIYLPWTSEFRLHIEIPDTDVNLYAFLLPDVQSLGFPSQTEFDQFLIAGGGTAGGWYAYLGIIPPSYIVDIQKV